MAHYRPQLTIWIEEQNWPPHVKAEYACALDIHFDNMLDLLIDELSEEIREEERNRIRDDI
tara:strand:- start:1423 stop:1605 length:183 start_codon:yes stop_codon:yes gene_type:complete